MLHLSTSREYYEGTEYLNDNYQVCAESFSRKLSSQYCTVNISNHAGAIEKISAIKSFIHKL